MSFDKENDHPIDGESPTPEGPPAKLEEMKTSLHWARESQALTSRILSILNRQIEEADAIREILAMVREFTGFEAVGLRLRKDGDFPYRFAIGFSQQFLDSESRLATRRADGRLVLGADGLPLLECMCGTVIRGRTDHTQPFFTEGGSFWVRSLSELITVATPEQLGCATRNRCYHEGYESLALVPLRSGREIIGLMQLNDRRKNLLSEEKVSLVESIAASIGVVLARVSSDQWLDASRSSFMDIAEKSPDGILVLDSSGAVLYANEATAEIFGMGPNKLVGTQFGLPVVPGDMTEIDIHRPDGEARVAELRMARADWYGHPAFVAMIRDFTERKRAQDRILRQRALLDGINKVFKETLTCQSVSEVAKTYLSVAEGITGSALGLVAEVNDQGLLDLVVVSDRTTDACEMGQSVQPLPKSVLEIRGLWTPVFKEQRSIFVNDPASHPLSVGVPEGHPRLTSFLGCPLTRGGGTFGVIALANKEAGYDSSDIEDVEALSVAFVEALDRLRAQEALRESETRFRQLAENIQDVFYLTSRGEPYELVYLSPTFGRIWGCTPSEPVERGPLWMRGIHEDDRPEIAQAYQDFIEGRSEFEVEYRIVRPDGTIRWIWDKGFIIKDEDGNVSRVGGLAQDITQRKVDQSKQEQLVQEIRNFAYIISHDLRAPIINMKGFSVELQNALTEVGPAVLAGLVHLDPEAQSAAKHALEKDIPEAIHFIHTSVARIEHLTNAILKLSRMGRREITFERLNMHALVTETLTTLAHQIAGRKARVTVELLPEIVGDRTCLEQIMTNLLMNAVNYLDPTRSGLITVSGRRAVEETLFFVQDNGRGIEPHDRERVFEIFRRVGKHEIPGEGLGLATVRTLVRRHGGRVWCDSQHGVGSTFTFTVSNHLVEGGDHG